MKKQFIFRVLPLMFAALISTQCDKDEDLTNFELITMGNWKVISILSDDVEIIQDCKLDNRYTFNTDGTFQFNAGSNNCGGGETSANTTWAFNSDETAVSIGGNTPKINQLDETTLVLEYTGFNVVETYKHP